MNYRKIPKSGIKSLVGWAEKPVHPIQVEGTTVYSYLDLAVETAATQTKPAYAGYESFNCCLVRAGGLGRYSPIILF